MDGNQLNPRGYTYRHHVLHALAWAVVGGLGITVPVFGQTMAIGQPLGQVYDYGNGNRVTCCPSLLIWGFDPYGVGACDGECNNGCRDWFVAHRPQTWFGSVDFVGLMRDPNMDVTLAQIGTINNPVILSSGDLQSEFDSGARVTVGRTLGECYQVEGSFLGNFAWQDTQTVATATETATAAMSGRMATAEVNFRTWAAMPPGPLDIQYLVGFRYFKGADSVNSRVVSGGGPPAGTLDEITASANNDLYGVQLGFNSKFMMTHTFFIDFDCKGAICQNFASQSVSHTISDDTGDTTISTNASSHRTAFLGDLLLTANLQLRPNLTLRAGYQAIFVSGAALAPQNLQANSGLLTSGPGQLIDDGNVAYHGPVIGLVGAW